MSRKRTVEERAQELRSKWAKLQVESATLKSMHIEGGMLDMTVDGARDLVLRMGVALRMTFDHIGATNYAQMTVNDPSKNSEHGQFLLTIQSANRPTPNELKVQAEKERDESKQLLADKYIEHSKIEACLREALEVAEDCILNGIVGEGNAINTPEEISRCYGLWANGDSTQAGLKQIREALLLHSTKQVG